MRMIESATKQKADEMSVPGTDEVNVVRKRRFAERIAGTLDGTVTGGDPLDVFRGIVGDYVAETGADPLELAAALAKMVQGTKPLLVEDLPVAPPRGEKRSPREGRRQAGPRPGPQRQGARRGPSARAPTPTGSTSATTSGCVPVRSSAPSPTRPASTPQHIGHIDIRPDHTLVELPADVPGHVVKRLQRARVAGRPMGLRRASGAEAASPSSRPSRPRR